MAEASSETEKSSLFKQLKAREDEARISLHELRMFVATVSFGMGEVGRLGDAFKEHCEKPNLVSKTCHQRLARAFVKSNAKTGTAVWEKFASDLEGNQSKLRNMAFMNAVAVFDAYLPDTFSIVLLDRPEMLRRTAKHMTFDQIIALGSMEELHRQMADRLLTEVAYLPFEAQWQSYENSPHQAVGMPGECRKTDRYYGAA